MYIQYLKYLRENKHPEVLVLTFLYDNNKRNTLYFRDYAKPKISLDVPINLDEIKLVRHPKNLKPCLNYFYSFCALSSLKSKINHNNSPDGLKNGTSVSANIFQKLKHNADKNGSQIIFISLPRYQMFNGNKKYYEYGLKTENWYKKICSKLSLNCLSFYAQVKDKPTQLKLDYYFQGSHFNRQGNEIVAELINKNLRKK